MSIPYTHEMCSLWYSLVFVSNEDRLNAKSIKNFRLIIVFLKQLNRHLISSRETNQPRPWYYWLYIQGKWHIFRQLKPMSFTPGRKLKSMSLKSKKKILFKTQNQTFWKQISLNRTNNKSKGWNCFFSMFVYWRPVLKLF